MLVICFTLITLTRAVFCSNSGKQAVVVSLPIGDKYYESEISSIATYQNELAEKAAGLDDLFILVPRAALPKFTRNLTDQGFNNIRKHAKCILTDSPMDLWTRDYTPIVPDQQVKFRYSPRYLSKKDSSFVDTLFRKMMTDMGIQLNTSQVSLDGGNVVSNGKDKAVITERIFEENKDLGWSRSEIQDEVEQQLRRKVAFIPDYNDTTGHSDGQVSFIEENVILICSYGDDVENVNYYNDVENAILTKFPNVTTVKVSCKGTPSKWRGFDTARNVYVNILVTNNAVYVPSFSQEHNQQVLTKVRNNVHGSTKVLSVNTSKLSKMGGSVRCMSWQLKSDNIIARALYLNSKPCLSYVPSSVGTQVRFFYSAVILWLCTTCFNILIAL